MASTFAVPAESITENSTAENIGGWDSFGFLQLVTNLEEAYKVSFDETELLRMNSYTSIKAILEGKGVEVS